jgi:hypothetical protein
LLNEIGLDPGAFFLALFLSRLLLTLSRGIDHCSAIKLLSSLRAEGKEIVSFISFCGGLPAPEHADVGSLFQ